MVTDQRYVAMVARLAEAETIITEINRRCDVLEAERDDALLRMDKAIDQLTEFMQRMVRLGDHEGVRTDQEAR